jgi:hypothetical protein
MKKNVREAGRRCEVGERFDTEVTKVRAQSFQGRGRQTHGCER